MRPLITTPFCRETPVSRFQIPVWINVLGLCIACESWRIYCRIHETFQSYKWLCLHSLLDVNVMCTQIRLYLPCTYWFGTKRKVFLWLQIKLKMVNTIWFRFELIRFQKYLSACNTVIIINNVYLTHISLLQNCWKISQENHI